MRRSTSLALLATLVGVAGLVALYFAAFYTWVAATPVAPARLEEVRGLAGWWGLAFVASIVGAGVLSALAWRHRRGAA